MGLEHLFTELLVATVFDSVHLKSVRVSVDVMLLREHVRDGVEGCDHAENHADDYHSVWYLISSKEGNVLSNIVGHLWCGGWGSVFILDHAVMKLRWHGNDHVIEVWVKVTTLRYIKTEWSGVVVASQQVVRVVRDTWLHGSCLREFRRPHTHVCALCLMDSQIWWPDSVMDLPLPVVPLLEVVTAMLLMGWMDLGEVHHFLLKLHLSETLVHDQVILLMHSSVASLARSTENLEASS